MILFFLCIISYDIWFYFSHIILHKKEYYIYHKRHHSIDYKVIRYYNTLESDIIENIIQPIGIFFPLFFVNFNLFYFLSSLIFVQIRGLLRHDLNCTWLIGNHHILHHKHFNYNFGEYWLDYLFGTKYPNDEEYIYGLIYI